MKNQENISPATHGYRGVWKLQACILCKTPTTGRLRDIYQTRKLERALCSSCAAQKGFRR